MTKVNKDVKTLQKALSDANKEIERLNGILDSVKSSRPRYTLKMEIRRNFNEVITTETREYCKKNLAQTDLIAFYYSTTGVRLDSASDFIRYVSDDGSTVAMFEIIKKKAL